MTGNVWEWVQDWYARDYYAQSPSVDSTGPATGIYKGVRGGGWGSDDPRYPRAAVRYYVRPEDRVIGVGFRCVAPHPQDSKK